MTDRTPFRPLDPGSLPHYPRRAAINAEALPHLTESDRVTAIVGMHDDGTAELLADLNGGRLPAHVRDARAAEVARIRAANEAPGTRHSNGRGYLLTASDQDAVDRAGQAAARQHEMAAAGYADIRTDALGGGVERPRGRHLAVVTLALVAVMAMLGVGVAPSADAAAAPVKGPGLTLRAEGRAVHVGPYRIAGRLLWCLDWALQVGDGPVRKGAPPAKLPAETRARVALIVNTHGATTDARTAARVKLALDTLVAPTDARLRKALPGMLAQMTAADRTAIAVILEASKVHAPYRASVDLTGAVLGQRGAATLTVLGSNGKPAAGRAVTLRVVGGTPAVVTTRTDARGRASAVFTATGLGQSVTATVTSPSSSAVWANVPSRGHQQMVGGGFTDTVTASDVAEISCPVEAELHKACPCNGAARWTYRYVVRSIDLPGAYRAWVQVNGTTVQAADLTGGGETVLAASVPAGSTVTVWYSILGTGGRALLTEKLDEVTQR